VIIVMAGRTSFSELTKDWNAEDKQQVKLRGDELRSEMALAEIRKLMGMSQAELGKAMGIQQPAVARLEKRQDMHISTLRKAIEALGGQLEIKAVIGDREINLTELGAAVG
jgi:DNA-binding XRE family transcriptional regulator